jgi:hypothetical protein
MKPYVLFIFIIILSLTSCEKKNNDPSFSFEAEVLGINMDCGIPAIKFSANLDQVNDIADLNSSNAIFIAKNLPSGLEENGFTIVLNIRKIQNSELGACTCMGPGYPWIYVLDAKKKE